MLDEKVDKETGKGLSTNDFTDAYKKALDGLNNTLNLKADLIDGKVPASQMPSYVDDTVEGYYYQGAFYEDSAHTTAITGERGKIYVDLTANKSYRWTGSVYTRIDECPAFGETAGTIYEGNKGKANADAIAAIKDGTNIDSFADVETALADKADKSTTYTKGQVDALLSEKADADDVYTKAQMNTELAKKVDKVTGKGLSTNDFTDAYKTELDGLDTALDGKVNKETGKGLSTNDYTTSEKTKLNSIESGANVNVQSDWNQTDTTADDYIKNKPNIPSGVVVDQVYDGTSTNAQSGVAIGGALSDKVDKVTGKGLSTNDYTTAEKDKLEGIASGAEVNVQSDWSQSDSSADDYIKNKPTIPTVNDAALTIQKNGTAVGTFSANAATAATINITVPVDAEDVDALPDTTKYGASLSLSIDSTTYVVTASLKDQDGNTLGTAQIIDLPLETVVVGGSYDDTTKKVILTLKNGNTIDFSVADLVAGLQTEITSTNKLDADLVDDTTSAHKFVTAADKSAWNAKSNFSGDYDDLTNKPTLGTAAAKGVDTAPTASSTNLVESGGVRNVVDVLEQMNGAKNRVNINASEVKSLNSAPEYTWNRNSCTVNGVTFTINNDNTITTSGRTQSGKSAIFTLCDFGPDGTSEFYGNILSGCARGGNYSTSYSLYLVKPDGNTLINNDNYKSAGTEIPKTNVVRYLRILFRESTSADNLTFKPMICSKETWDAGFTSYQPYALPNTTITPAFIKQVNEGAKNLVINFGRIENNGCIFTYGSDGRITVTGTKSTALAMAEFISNQNLSNYGLSAGDKIVVVNDNENVGIEVIFANDQGTADPSISVYKETRTITIPSGRTKWYLRLQIKPSVTGTINEIVKPMVCDKRLYDIDPTVTPYAMSNLELTENVKSLSGIAKADTFTTVANQYVYTNQSFTVPAGKIAIFTASVFYNASKPSALKVGKNANPEATDEDATLWFHEVGEVSLGALSVSGITQKRGTDITYYIHANYAGAGTNAVSLYYRII